MHVNNFLFFYCQLKDLDWYNKWKCKLYYNKCELKFSTQLWCIAKH